MRLRRGHAKLAIVLAACAVAVGAVIAGLIITSSGHDSSALAYQSSAVAPTTGSWAPITVARPKVPIIGGAMPVDIDPRTTRTDFDTTLFPLPGSHRYRMTIFNTSNVGAVNSLQWYPPTGMHILKVLGSSAGHCTASGLTGFGGNQFPTLVLYPNILCDQLDLKPPSCTCLGNGGSVTVSFVTDKNVAVDAGDLRMRAATVVFDRIPAYLPRPPASRPFMRVAAADPSNAADSGGLTADERDAAQTALDSLQNSNIAFQLTAITKWVQSVPAACRIRLVSQNPSRYKVYVFWIPWLASVPYVWLNMNVTADPRTSTFHLGTVEPVLPGGRLTPGGRSVNRKSVDTTLLSRYGAPQAKKSQEILASRGGNVFASPSANCQVLENGSLRLLAKS
jgi:hypothetical protein